MLGQLAMDYMRLVQFRPAWHGLCMASPFWVSLFVMDCMISVHIRSA